MNKPKMLKKKQRKEIRRNELKAIDEGKDLDPATRYKKGNFMRFSDSARYHGANPTFRGDVSGLVKWSIGIPFKRVWPDMVGYM